MSYKFFADQSIVREDYSPDGDAWSRMYNSIPYSDLTNI